MPDSSVRRKSQVRSYLTRYRERGGALAPLLFAQTSRKTDSTILLGEWVRIHSPLFVRCAERQSSRHFLTSNHILIVIYQMVGGRGFESPVPLFVFITTKSGRIWRLYALYPLNHWRPPTIILARVRRAPHPRCPSPSQGEGVVSNLSPLPP